MDNRELWDIAIWFSKHSYPYSLIVLPCTFTYEPTNIYMFTDNLFESNQQSAGTDVLDGIFGTSGTNDILMAKPEDKKAAEDKEIAANVLKNETLDKVLDKSVEQAAENKLKREQEQKVEPVVVAKAESILDSAVSETLKPAEEVEEQTTAGRPKTEKNTLISYLKKKIEANDYGLPDTIEFDAAKQSLDDVLAKQSEESLHSILDANWAAKEKALIDQTPTEFFESLPESLQYAAKAVAAGAGEDQLQDIYKALLRVEQVKALDERNEDHQPAIIQSYLQATGWKQEAIAEQIEEWKENNKLSKKAAEFKPMLDDMQREQVEGQVRVQEEQRKREEQLANFYSENVYNTLKGNELAGVKLDKKWARQLADNMTNTVQSPWNGQPVNYLGYGLHKAQFVEPDYEAVMIAAWVLNDKKAALEALGQRSANAQVEKDVKLIKANQPGFGTSGQPQIAETKKQIKRINTSNVLKRPSVV